MQRQAARRQPDREPDRDVERYTSPFSSSFEQRERRPARRKKISGAKKRPPVQRPRPDRDERPLPGIPDGTRRGAFDISLAGVALLLVVLGLMFVLSSSSYTAGIKGDSFADFRSQLMWAVVGLGGMIVMTIADYRFLRNAKFVWLVMGVTITLLLLLMILPRTGFVLTSPKINGSRRWIRVMAGNTVLLSLQPSELAKFALILFLTVKLSNRPKDLPHFTRSILPCFAVAGVFFGLVMLQPNLSTAGTLMIVTIIILFASGVSIKQLFGPIMVLIPIAIALVVLEPYRFDRFLSFRDPWSMAGDEAYQLIQSFYALANGGLFGTGFGMSRQKHSFLPYASSDFIFAIVAEEVGFIGALVILLLFLALIYFGLRTAMRCPDRFGTLLATGLTALIAVQVIINIAVVTGSMPTTGLPLPFFTAGGTSLAIFMTEIGILLSISRHKRITDT